MKSMKKFAGIALALVLVLALMVPAMAADAPAAESTGYTITISNSAKGVKYSVYKIFDATVDGNAIVYLTDKAIPEALSEYVELGTEVSKGVYEVAKTDKYDGTDFIKALGTLDPKDFGTAAEEVEGTGGALAIEGLAPGYYLIVRSTGETSAVSVASTVPNASVIDKNDSTPVNYLEKTVDDGSDSVAVGDTVTYTVKFKTANFVVKTENGVTTSTPITSYTIKDELPAEVSLATVIGFTIGGEDYKTDGNYPQFGTDGTITVPWALLDDEDNYKSSIYADGAEIVITYQVTVLETAADATDGMTNKVTITYNDGQVGQDKEKKIYTYSVEVTKLDGTDKTTILTGAEFELYEGVYDEATNTWSKGDKRIQVVDKGEGRYVVAGDQESEGDTIVAGQITIDGLDADVHYFLVETKAPNGYNLLTDPAEITLKTNEVNSMPVYNNAGAELPSTGGIGTTIFTVGGAVLMIGAAILFISKKRSVNA